MKRMLALAFSLLALTALPGLAHADTKIGYVDLERALEETAEGKQVIAKLKSDFEKKQKELDTRSSELRKLKEDLDKQKAVLKADAYGVKEQELGQKLQLLQETFVRLQQDLQKRQAEEMSRMLKKMQAIIAGIAEKEKLTFMLNKSSSLPTVLWAPSSLDYTSELIRKYDASPAK